MTAVSPVQRKLMNPNRVDFNRRVQTGRCQQGEGSNVYFDPRVSPTWIRCIHKCNPVVFSLSVGGHSHAPGHAPEPFHEPDSLRFTPQRATGGLWWSAAATAEESEEWDLNTSRRWHGNASLYPTITASAVCRQLLLIALRNSVEIVVGGFDCFFNLYCIGKMCTVKFNIIALMGDPVKSDRVRGSEFEFQFPCSPEVSRLPRLFVFVLFFCLTFSLRVFCHAFRGSIFSSCYIKYTSHWVGVFSVYLSVSILVHTVRLLYEFSQNPHKTNRLQSVCTSWST